MTTTKRGAAATKTPKAVEATLETVQDNIETAVEASKEAASGNYEKAYSMMNDRFDLFGKNLFANFENVAEFGKQNMEAVVASSTAWGKGVEGMSKAWMDFLRKSAEENVSATKSIMAAKSVKEAVDLQSSYAKSAYEACVAEGNSLSEMGVKLANDAAAPITERFNATVAKLNKAA